MRLVCARERSNLRFLVSLSPPNASSPGTQTFPRRQRSCTFISSRAFRFFLSPFTSTHRRHRHRSFVHCTERLSFFFSGTGNRGVEGCRRLGAVVLHSRHLSAAHDLFVKYPAFIQNAHTRTNSHSLDRISICVDNSAWYGKNSLQEISKYWKANRAPQVTLLAESL